MKLPSGEVTAPVNIEIDRHTLRARRGNTGMTLPLERAADGQLTEVCRSQIQDALRSFAARRSWQAEIPARCAIDARGVSVRRLKLPPTPPDKLREVLRLQIEAESPVPIEELSWGWALGNGAGVADPGPAGGGEIVLVAARKQLVEGYATLLKACGLAPRFTLAALARQAASSNSRGSFALLNLGKAQSEWLPIEDGKPGGVRLLPWGSQSLTDRVQLSSGLPPAELESALARLAGGDPPAGSEAILSAIDSAAADLVRTFPARTFGGRLVLTADGSIPPALVRALERLLPEVRIEALDVASRAGNSAAIEGLQRAGSDVRNLPLPWFETEEHRARLPGARRLPERWLRRAAALALVAAVLPYAEAVLFKPQLTRRLAALRADKGRLETIDSEFAFLQQLKKDRPPYLEALFLLSKSIPPGTRFENVSMNRRGELTLLGLMRNGDQVVDFRSKLLASGFFSTVVVEEQTPTQNRQNVNVRIQAVWKATESRPTIPPGPDPAPPGGSSPSGPPRPQSPPSSGPSGPPGMPMPPVGAPPGNPSPVPSAVPAAGSGGIQPSPGGPIPVTPRPLPIQP